MKSLGQRIKKQRLELNRTQEAIAEATGVTKQAVGKWEKDETVPTGPNLVALAEYLGVSERWLVDGKKPKTRLHGRQLEMLEGPIISVPLISWVQAGRVGEAFDPYEAGSAEDFYPVPYHRESLFALRVMGQSMNKEAPEGSIVIVDFEDQALVSGSLYVFKTADGEVSFKRYRSNPDRFEPASTESHETIFPAAGWTVIGRVVQVVRRL